MQKSPNEKIKSQTGSNFKLYGKGLQQYSGKNAKSQLSKFTKSKNKKIHHSS